VPFDQKLNPLTRNSTRPPPVYYDGERAFYQSAEGTGQSPTGATRRHDAKEDTPVCVESST